MSIVDTIIDEVVTQGVNINADQVVISTSKLAEILYRELDRKNFISQAEYNRVSSALKEIKKLVEGLDV